jgi:hypothetical protein
MQWSKEILWSVAWTGQIIDANSIGFKFIAPGFSGGLSVMMPVFF